jgi:hypothetical protein
MSYANSLLRPLMISIPRFDATLFLGQGGLPGLGGVLLVETSPHPVPVRFATADDLHVLRRLNGSAGRSAVGDAIILDRERERWVAREDFDSSFQPADTTTRHGQDGLYREQVARAHALQMAQEFTAETDSGRVSGGAGDWLIQMEDDPQRGRVVVAEEFGDRFRVLYAPRQPRHHVVQPFEREWIGKHAEGLPPEVLALVLGYTPGRIRVRRPLAPGEPEDSGRALVDTVLLERQRLVLLPIVRQLRVLARDVALDADAEQFADVDREAFASLLAPHVARAIRTREWILEGDHEVAVRGFTDRGQRAIEPWLRACGVPAEVIGPLIHRVATFGLAQKINDRDLEQLRTWEAQFDQIRMRSIPRRLLRLVYQTEAPGLRPFTRTEWTDPAAIHKACAEGMRARYQVELPPYNRRIWTSLEAGLVQAALPPGMVPKEAVRHEEPDAAISISLPDLDEWGRVVVPRFLSGT